MPQAITLQVFRSDQLVSTQTFDRDIIKIGRLPSAHLRLEDLKVARIHAVIEMTAGGKEISIIDMGSAEGTFLNGEKIQKAKLKDRDQIVLGDTRLLFTVGGGAAAVAGSPTSTTVAATSARAKEPEEEKTAKIPHLPAAVPSQPLLQPQAELPTPSQPVATTQVDSDKQWEPQFTHANVDLPTFDRGSNDHKPMERIGHDQLRNAAFSDSHHASIGPEPQMTVENRALEMRTYWGDIVLDINHLIKPKQVTIGETRHTDIFISSEGLPKEEFPLIRHIGDDYVLTFFNDLEGEIETNGENKTLKEMRSSSRVTKDENIEGCYQLTMSMDTRAIVHWGGLTLAMRFVPPPQRLKNVGANLDYQFLNIALIVFFLVSGMIFSFSLYPFEAEALSEELFKSDNRFAQFLLEPPKPPEQIKQAQEFLNRMQEKEARGPAKAKGDEGKFGKTNAAEKDAHSAVKAIKPDDKEVIKNAGILKFLGGSSGFSQVMGPNSGLGGDVQNAIGNLTGKTVGDSGGLGGLGLRGTGPGGGGIGDSIGLAKGVGTMGRIGGTAGYGSDKGSIGAKKDLDINIADAAPVVQGSLDPALIKKVIQENRNAIKYCFERQLQIQKDLGGTIRTQFIISPSGTVTAAMVKESTMKSPPVENCIVGKIRGFVFPKPKGGGIVIVNYPFVFKSAN